MNLGKQLAAACKGGEVFELISDLGGGKTTLVRGMAEAFGVADNVTSPTFSINNTYRTNKLTIQHFDFFRLNDAGVVGEELKEYLGDNNSIIVIEWGDIVHKVLPDLRVIIKINSLGDYKRAFEILYPLELEYLMSEIS